jgi:flavin reductase (DIM6/NTAB) family NADH-FMN oxidoreductase RutF
MRALALSKVYQLIEPGPVVLLTTARKGRANVMTMSWHMMVEFEPPLVACVVSSANYSFTALRAAGECVVAVPGVTLADKVAQAGNCSGRDIDKFAAIGLTRRPAKRVDPPLLAECIANLECRVSDTRLVSKYNLFILEVLAAWVDPKQKNAKTIHHQAGAEPPRLGRGQSSDFLNRAMLMESSPTPSTAMPNMSGHSASRPTPLRNVARITTR